MRDTGLERAIEAAGGVGALARALGLPQPSVSGWDRVPPDRVAAVGAATGIAPASLRPDLYGQDEASPSDGTSDLDETSLARAREYRLLAALLARAPDAERLRLVGAVRGDASPLGMAHLALAEAARAADPGAVQREYFRLFVGLGRGEFLPYGSYYLTGFLHERPLARLREDLARLGFEPVAGRPEPEDHAASLCDVMAALAEDGDEVAGRAFFERHVKPWMGRFFAEVELSTEARFYKPVALVGRLFMDIEADAFSMPT